MATAAAAAAVTMAMPKASTTNPRRPLAGSDAFSNPMRLSSHKASASTVKSSNQLMVRASSSWNKEKVVSGLTAAAVAAALVLPDVAEAAQPGISPSLKNFLLSILSGGVVVGAIIGAVIGVSNFDPVKRG